MDRQIKHNLTGQHGYDQGMTDKPFLTIGEVADILQVSSRTVYNLIYKGTLRACRLTYHITIITREDFFLMIRETTYCKRSVSIFSPSEAADIKSVMQSYGETTEQQKAVGAWLCDYAEHRQPFDEIKHRHTLKEVGDVAEGRYDWKIERGRSGISL